VPLEEKLQRWDEIEQASEAAEYKNVPRNPTAHDQAILELNKLVLKYKIPPSFKDEDQQNLFLHSCYSNNLALFYLCCEVYGHPLKELWRNKLPVQWAMNYRAFSIGRALLPSCEDIELDKFCETTGLTMLHDCCMDPAGSSCVRELVRRHATINVRERNYYTPLHLAALHRCTVSIHILCDK
jgi:ankyrin repeat protein